MRILYDHQVFSLQNAGGASRYYYELMRALSSDSEVHTELCLGINDTVFPFRKLPRRQAHIVSWGAFPRRGRWRYIANEVLAIRWRRLPADSTYTTPPSIAVCRWSGRGGWSPLIMIASTNASPAFFRTSGKSSAPSGACTRRRTRLSVYRNRAETTCCNSMTWRRPKRE